MKIFVKLVCQWRNRIALYQSYLVIRCYTQLCDTNCRHLHPKKRKERLTCEYLNIIVTMRAYT